MAALAVLHGQANKEWFCEPEQFATSCFVLFFQYLWIGKSVAVVFASQSGGAVDMAEGAQSTFTLCSFLGNTAGSVSAFSMAVENPRC